MEVKVYCTSGIEDYIERGVINESDVLCGILNFSRNNWGELCEEDKELQYELLQLENSKKTERFMGVYFSFDTKFWIMSDYDYTINTLLITVLLPEEY